MYAIKPDWLLDSIQQGKRLPEIDYAVIKLQNAEEMHKYLFKQSTELVNNNNENIQPVQNQPEGQARKKLHPYENKNIDKKDLKTLKFLNLLSNSPSIKLSQRLKNKQQELLKHANDNADNIHLNSPKSSQSSQSSQSSCGSPKKSQKRKHDSKDAPHKAWKIALDTKPECKQFPKAQSVPPHLVFVEKQHSIAAKPWQVI